ncbi:MAG: beta-phosphoglucomutase [Phycisphaerales bacterium]|jgi:beta-phosphoglucomutase
MGSTGRDSEEKRSIGVIFDFDGTLADSEPVHEAAIRAIVEPMGWWADEPALFARYIGTSDRYCFRDLGERAGETVDDARLDGLVEAKRLMYLEYLEAGKVRAFDGAMDLVRAAAAGGPIAVCSGSRTPTIEPTLVKFGVRDLLSALVGADQVSNAKPHPESYLLTCERLGLAPSRCVAIEDTDHGINAAKGAGIRTIAVAHTCGPDRLSGADEVFENIGQITVEALRG